MQSFHFFNNNNIQDGSIKLPLFPSVERAEGLDRYYRNLCHAAKYVSL